MNITVDSSTMVSLSYRLYDRALRAYFWVTGDQHKESRVRDVANRLAEQGALGIHWEQM